MPTPSSYLAAIGRRGGLQRSHAKRRAARTNLAKARAAKALKDAKKPSKVGA